MSFQYEQILVADIAMNSKRGFEFTVPVPWNLLEDIDFKVPGVRRENEPYWLNSETKVVYDDTTFGKLEPRFKSLSKKPLA